MNAVLAEIVIIILLLVANGIFSMTEMAVVSSRKVRLKRLAKSGDAGARLALELAESPNRFLPTVQIGITLVGLLAGAFGGITLAEHIAAALQPFPALAPYAEAIGVGVVVISLTYLSLVIGELVPKRLALSNPEGIASRMARPMDFLSRLTRPVIRLLGASTDLVLWLLRVRQQKRAAISEEEVKLLMQEGTDAGVFHQAEPRMVESVLAFDRLPVKDIMTPRGKLVFLNKDDSHEAVWHKIVVSGHSNFPVYSGRRDCVVGVVSVKAIYANLAANVGVKLSDLMTPPLIVPATETVTQLLDSFKKTGRHIALVSGADGAMLGLVTLVDVLEAIVGEIPTLEERLKPVARRREDGSWLVDGRFPLARLEPLLEGVRFPRTPEFADETLADFMARQLPPPVREGSLFTWQGYSFEVLDMDRQVIDKVFVMPEPTKP